MRSAWIVARHEFSVTVRRLWFIIATFVSPLVMIGIWLLVLLMTRGTVERRVEAQTSLPMGFVDHWGELGDREGFERCADEEEARRKLVDGKVWAYVVIPDNYLETARVRIVTRQRPTLLTAEQPLLTPDFRSWMIDTVLREIDDPVRVTRAKNPIEPQVRYVDERGEVLEEDRGEVIRRTLLAAGFCIFLFMSIMTATSYLLQGMAEEKEHRVMEVVLASITPVHLMMGKLLGLGAAGLLQLCVWYALAIGAVFTFGVALEPSTVAICTLFFLFGYLMYGSLMLGFGSLGTNFRESHQMASIWAMVAVIPLMALMVILEEPHGTLARVLTFIPLTTPATMMLRYGVDPAGIPLPELVGAVLLLMVSSGLALLFSARLFRVGLLLYGKRPGLREIWRWIRTAS